MGAAQGLEKNASCGPCCQKVG